MPNRALDFRILGVLAPTPEGMIEKLTFKKSSCEINAHIPIPSGLTHPFHRPGNLLRFHLLYADQDPFLVSEANNDLGHAKQEGLDPELHELALIG